ncbi:3-dehydroquinate synthase [bacterium]|nr:3-dehydroquinate synthase [bacterium]
MKSILDQENIPGPFYVISDRNVFRHQGRRLEEALRGAPFHHFLAPPGETSKDLKYWKRIQDFLLKKGADRRSAVIAFGGGVIGDLAGFAASTYMRGLDLIQIPTTLLSQSDSSIGAKVAVNHPKAKNLIGSFYQPRIVITDPALLESLPPREFSAGLGEAIKYGVISDPELFELLHANVEKILSYDREMLGSLIARCIAIKIQVVEEDERESGLRKILNFGHTIGHALEQATRYKVLRHGEAVAWGMLAAGWIAIRRNMWDSGEFEKLKSILVRSKSMVPFGDLKRTDILNALKHDKKKAGKKLSFVLPERTGKVTIVKDISQEEIETGLDYILRFRN